MKKEDLKRISENPKYIEGIYNYCDRWCERCPFTSRCLNCELSENQMNDPEMRDHNNKIFWDNLSEVLKITIDLIEEEAEEEGIDIHNLYQEDENSFYEVRERVFEGNGNLNFAEQYIDLVKKWFRNTEEDFIKKQEQILTDLSLEIENANSYDDALTITDAVEIIKWYQYQIFIKIKRGLFNATDDEVFLIENQDSSDGSIKVALIGIDRSIGAWGKLYKYFKERQDDILDILLHLTKMRNKLESDFPNAREFKRIGFDD